MHIGRNQLRRDRIVELQKAQAFHCSKCKPHCGCNRTRYKRSKTNNHLCRETIRKIEIDLD